MELLGKGGGKSCILSKLLYFCLLTTQEPPAWQPTPRPHFTDQLSWADAEGDQEHTSSSLTFILFIFKPQEISEIVDQIFICWTSSKLIATSWRIQSTMEPNHITGTSYLLQGYNINLEVMLKIRGRKVMSGKYVGSWYYFGEKLQIQWHIYTPMHICVHVFIHFSYIYTHTHTYMLFIYTFKCDLFSSEKVYQKRGWRRKGWKDIIKYLKHTIHSIKVWQVFAIFVT